MQCPVCQANMRVSDREAVEINYCPECGGLWLPRGALEAIVARASAGTPQRSEGTNNRRDDDDDDEHDADDAPRRGGRGRPDDEGRRGEEGRRGGFREMLGNLFDFG